MAVQQKELRLMGVMLLWHKTVRPILYLHFPNVSAIQPFSFYMTGCVCPAFLRDILPLYLARFSTLLTEMGVNPDYRD